MDLEFGTWTDGLSNGATKAYDNYYLANPYLKKLRSGELPVSELDTKVRNVLRLIFRTAMNPDKPFGALCSEAHYAAARKIGGEGIVLLKNDGSVLPIKNAKRILVVGENAVKMMTVGGGSSSLKVEKEISPLDGIRARAAQDGIEVKYVRGYVGDVGGSYNGVTTGQDLSESRSAKELIAEAVKEAANADYVIFVGGLNKSKHQDCEGSDRYSLSLSYGQDEVISALSAANSKLVVALVSGNAVAMPWIAAVPSILQTWYLGSEAGEALADVVFGDVNPSGKLPFTFPKRLIDSPAHAEGDSLSHTGKYFYKEGIYVGYRWFDEKGIEPLFAFGHGLSYTTFMYGDARLSASVMKADGKLKVTVPVTNTGKVAGAEVVQLYISDAESYLPRPRKELKGFEKVYLEPGETAEVTFTLDSSALKFFDADRHEWVAEPGEFTLLLGSASDDIRTSAKFTLK